MVVHWDSHCRLKGWVNTWPWGSTKSSSSGHIMIPFVLYAHLCGGNAMHSTSSAFKGGADKNHNGPHWPLQQECKVLPPGHKQVSLLQQLHLPQQLLRLHLWNCHWFKANPVHPLPHQPLLAYWDKVLAAVEQLNSCPWPLVTLRWYELHPLGIEMSLTSSFLDTSQFSAFGVPDYRCNHRAQWSRHQYNGFVCFYPFKGLCTE